MAKELHAKERQRNDAVTQKNPGGTAESKMTSKQISPSTIKARPEYRRVGQATGQDD